MCPNSTSQTRMAEAISHHVVHVKIASRRYSILLFQRLLLCGPRLDCLEQISSAQCLAPFSGFIERCENVQRIRSMRANSMRFHSLLSCKIFLLAHKESAHVRKRHHEYIM
jgi:hypothetical protein